MTVRSWSIGLTVIESPVGSLADRCCFVVATVASMGAYRLDVW